MPHRPSEDPTRRVDVPSLRASLLDFFDRERRDLPWRRTGDPYAIWVSEVMLQQTRVETAGPYFERWMQAFPTVQALADAPESRVLKLWEGLGYYSRARNLHRAARLVCESPAAALPTSAAQLRTLPGIGPYTAGAIASIAFGEAAPAVDGNVRRVLARLFDVADPAPRELEQWASALVDPDRPGDFNQALMELGSLVCTPRRPDCHRCVWHHACRAYAAGTVAERPAPKRRAQVIREHRAVLVAAHRMSERGWCLRVERRPPDGLLAGMWAFPDALLTDVEDGATPLSVVHALRRERRHDPEQQATLEPVHHLFSHRDVTYHPHVVCVGPPEPAGPDVVWLPIYSEPEVALPVAQRRIFDHAREWLSATFPRSSLSPRTD